jgi:transketolase
MLNPHPHISTHEPWIWRQFAHQLPLDTARTGCGTRAVSAPDRYRLPTWSPGELVATHGAYQAALRTIGAADPRMLALEGDSDSSTYTQTFPATPALPPIESVIAEHVSAAPEQRMVAAAIALQSRAQIPFAATFADFWTTAHDLIRMAAINGANIRLIGWQSAVAGDEDGPSQLALEDIAMFRAIHDSTVLIAADANQTAALVATMLEPHGVAYLRTLRLATPVIYRPGERFPIGGSRTLRSSKHDDVTLIGAGATVQEALAAADTLVRFDIRARVVDLYSVQPLDAPTVIDAARETGNIIVAEDHWPAGGLGDAVLETLADADIDARVRRLAVHTRPTSGRPEELLGRTGIDRTGIATAARDLLEQPTRHHDHRRSHGWGRALRRSTGSVTYAG